MQLQHVFAAGRLMQPVDILRDDRAQLAFGLQFRQTLMRPVRLNAVDHELFPVEAVIFLRVAGEKARAEDRLGRIFPLLVVQAVHAAEIRDPAFRADACAAEKDDVAAPVDPVFELLHFRIHPVRLPYRF